MPPDLEDALRALAAAADFARRYRVKLTGDYLARLAVVEALPQNQAGADKGGRWRGSVASHRARAARAVRQPRR